jgi:hypothetical protein
MNTDFIPRGIAKFTEYIKVAYQKVQTKLSAYGITSQALAVVTPAYNRYIAAEAVTSNPDTATPGARRERDHARKDLESKWREFINVNIRYNVLVPVADLEVFGLKDPDNIRTPVKPPTAVAYTATSRTGAFQFEARVSDEATGKIRLPKDASGSYIYLTVTDIGQTPESPDDFHKLDFSSNAFHTILFRHDQLGKMAHIYARYSNVHGKEGPEGPTETFIIS